MTARAAARIARGARVKTIKRLALAVVMLAAATCAADEFAEPAPGAARTPAWCSLGLGWGGSSNDYGGDTLQNASYLLAFSAQKGAGIFTLRYTNLDNGRSEGDLAALYEHAFSRRRMLVSGGLGLGLRHESVHTVTWAPVLADKSWPGDTDGELGLAWSLQAVTRMHEAAGVGFTAYGWTNGDVSQVGMGLVMQFGWMAGRD